MEFLYSAYYNGNISEDKVKFIEKLGYHLENFYPKQSENTGVATSSNTRGVHFIPKSLFFNTNPHISWNISGRINCCKNWDMFETYDANGDDIKIDDIERWTYIQDLS